MKMTAQAGLVLAGCLPFLLGRTVNRWWGMRWLLVYVFVAAAFLLLWAGIAFIFRGMTGNTASVVLPLNAVGAVVLVLIAIQQLFFGHFWYNSIGHYTRAFYAPLYRLARLITFRPMSWFVTYCICFALMVAASYIGCRMGRRR